jgi:hypothetical protein
MMTKGKALRDFTLDGVAVTKGDDVSYPANQFADFVESGMVEAKTETKPDDKPGK